MSINRVILTGNLTRDAELRALPSGSSVLSFGLAVNERRPKAGSDNEWEDVANFFDCDLFGKRADSLAPHLTKGLRVGIDGRLRYSAWEKDGQKRSKVNIVVENFEFLANKSDSAGGGAAPAAAVGEADSPAVSVYDGEEVPF